MVLELKSRTLLFFHVLERTDLPALQNVCQIIVSTMVIYFPSLRD